MSQLTNQVTYGEMKRIAKRHFNEETLKSALADVVNAITDLDTTSGWGEGKTASCDSQRFLFPQKVLQRAYSPRFGDFALGLGSDRKVTSFA